jgi:hypothetical protein
MITSTAPLPAYRAFVADQRGLLTLSEHALWTGGDREAVCWLGRWHRAPAPRCSCGIHAYDRLDLAERNVWDLVRAGRLDPYAPVLFGVVLLWGRPRRPVLATEVAGGWQYRAPFGRLVALAPGAHAEWCAWVCGVPVLEPAALEAYARQVAGIEAPAPAGADTHFTPAAMPGGAWREPAPLGGGGAQGGQR